VGNCDTVSDRLFTNGTYLSVSTLTNMTGNVVMADFKVVRYDGTIICSDLFDIQKYASVTYGDANWWKYVPPIMGFTTEMIGAWNYQYTLFESLHGNFIWTAIRDFRGLERLLCRSLSKRAEYDNPVGNEELMRAIWWLLVFPWVVWPKSRHELLGDLGPGVIRPNLDSSSLSSYGL
jgi:hypothetical protein